MKLIHPYDRMHGGQWIKGNLHAHTNLSDGYSTRQGVVDDYAALGYGFLMISDHEVHASAHDLAALDARNMVLLPGYEVTNNGPHMLHVNAGVYIQPHSDRQRVLDAIGSDAGSLAIVNHPNWTHDFNHCRQELLETWKGYAGIEIFNGVVDLLEGSAYATDRWDRLLSSGRRIWGFAHDDSHSPAHIATGWDVAYVTERTPRGVSDALAKGRFYASTGVTIQRIVVDESANRIRIDTADADRIKVYGTHQRFVGSAEGSSIVIDFPPDQTYIRFECYGRGGRQAWTQPFFRVD